MDKKEYLNRIGAYKRLFASADGKLVLDDLRKWCHDDDTTFSDNPYETSRNEGRRQVLLHIKRHIDVDLEEVSRQLNVEGSDAAMDGKEAIT